MKEELLYRYPAALGESGIDNGPLLVINFYPSLILNVTAGD